ncbi:hypothetical protein BH11PAT4_BH11PAT4_8370 [soil metagenome]
MSESNIFFSNYVQAHLGQAELKMANTEDIEEPSRIDLGSIATSTLFEKASTEKTGIEIEISGDCLTLECRIVPKDEIDEQVAAKKWPKQFLHANEQVLQLYGSSFRSPNIEHDIIPKDLSSEILVVQGDPLDISYHLPGYNNLCIINAGGCQNLQELLLITLHELGHAAQEELRPPDFHQAAHEARALIAEEGCGETCLEYPPFLTLKEIHALLSSERDAWAYAIQQLRPLAKGKGQTLNSSTLRTSVYSRLMSYEDRILSDYEERQRWESYYKIPYENRVFAPELRHWKPDSRA